jgi:tetratricopeptide (TPR) repeat protein
VMPDGSAPPKSVGIERICSDIQATAPGPLTDKKGHFTWPMDLDPENTRDCSLRATMPGFTSTRVDVSDLNLGDFQQNKIVKLPDLVLAPRDSGGGNTVVLIPADEAPGKVQALYKAAVKAMDAKNQDEAIKQLLLAVKAVPKFADGWNILGAVYEQRQMLMEARDALQHAVEANPKLASPYLRLARISNKLGDWNAAAKNEDALLKIESRFFPEIYLQQGITRFELNDLAGAEASLKTAQSMNPAHPLIRAEYVLGRIALAKGDLSGAKEHIANYVKADPAAADIDKIQAQLDSLGSPDAPKLDITLERP